MRSLRFHGPAAVAERHPGSRGDPTQGGPSVSSRWLIDPDLDGGEEEMGLGGSRSPSPLGLLQGVLESALFAECR